MKLVVEEPESQALRELLSREPAQITSALAEVEVLRAVRQHAPQLSDQAQSVVEQVAVVDVSEAIRARAALLEPTSMRSLDALHLATALELGDDLRAIVTYDTRMSEAAASVGIAVLAPT